MLNFGINTIYIKIKQALTIYCPQMHIYKYIYSASTGKQQVKTIYKSFIIDYAQQYHKTIYRVCCRAMSS